MSNLETEKIVKKAIATGVNPDVARKAVELQEALRTVPTDKAMLIKKLAKEAAQLARLDDNDGALKLLNQALEEAKQ